MPSCLSGAKEALLLLILGVVGQSFDSYADIGLSYWFAKGTTYNGKFNQQKHITTKSIPLFLWLSSNKKLLNHYAANIKVKSTLAQ